MKTTNLYMMEIMTKTQNNKTGKTKSVLKQVVFGSCSGVLIGMFLIPFILALLDSPKGLTITLAVAVAFYFLIELTLWSIE